MTDNFNKLQNHLKEKVHSIYNDGSDSFPPSEDTPSLWDNQTPELLNTLLHNLRLTPHKDGVVYFIPVRNLINEGFPIPLVMNLDYMIPVSSLKVKKIDMGITLYLDYDLTQLNY